MNRKSGIVDGMSMGAFKSIVRIKILNPDGSLDRERVYSNKYTYSTMERILRTLVQTTSGDKLDSTGWAKKVALSSGTFPADPYDSDISDVEGYEDLSTAANITETSEEFTVTRTASWVNSSGSSVDITYLALTYGSSVSKGQVFCMVDLGTPETVNDGQTALISYTNQITKNTSYWAPLL